MPLATSYIYSTYLCSSPARFSEGFAEQVWFQPLQGKDTHVALRVHLSNVSSSVFPSFYCIIFLLSMCILHYFSIIIRFAVSVFYDPSLYCICLYTIHVFTALTFYHPSINCIFIVSFMSLLYYFSIIHLIIVLPFYNSYLLYVFLLYNHPSS